MSSFSSKKLIGTNDLASHGLNMGIKTPSFFIPRLPRDVERILQRVLEISSKIGLKKLMI